MKPLKILEVGCEGGSITLFGWKGDDGEWHFLREIDEGTLMDMMPKDDQEGLCFYSKTEAVTGWSEALKLLYKYPWPRMYPLFVLPEFADLVMGALKDAPDEYRMNVDFQLWYAVCSGKDRFEKG